MGKERREAQELHDRFDKHDPYLLDMGCEHMARQWGYCSCGMFFRRELVKMEHGPMPWHPITGHRLLVKMAKYKGRPGIDRLRDEVLYCKRIGSK